MEFKVVDQPHIPALPDQVRVRAIEMSPHRHGRRVKVAIDLSSFRIQPDINLVDLACSGEEGASASVIGSVDKKMLLALPISGKTPPGSNAAHVFLRFQGEGLVHREGIHFAVPQVPTAEGE
jgi:hypothetical protein